MRDVVLMRKDAGVSTTFDYSQRFRKDHSLVIENIGGTVLDLTVWRGFVALDANVRGTEFRFVNTHLEAFDNTAKLAQAEELVAGIAEVGAGEQDEIGPANPAAELITPVVLVGDLNSDDEIVETVGDTPSTRPTSCPTRRSSAGLEERSYDGLNTDGVDDQFSCCFGAELIDEPPPARARRHRPHGRPRHGRRRRPRRRRRPEHDDIELVNSFATGNDPDEFERSTAGPSDHLGVVSVLQFPTP